MADRKAHVAEEKAVTKAEGVNSPSIDAKPKKRKKVDMDTLIIGFSRLDFKNILAPHDDPLIITTRVHGYEVLRLLVY